MYLLVAGVAACDPPNAGTDSSLPPPLTVSSDVVRSAPRDDAPVVELASGFNGAGFDLWRTQPVDGNLVFSPLSIGHALLMARAAADDATAQNIDAVFGLPEGLAAHEGWNAFDHQVAALDGAEEEITIRMADRIWPHLDVTPDQGWVDLLASQHGASVVPLDLQGDGEGSRDTINAWVSEQTMGLVPQLLPMGFIQPTTVLVLTDAVYFAARWSTVFGKYGSVMDEFTKLDGSKVPVELMREIELSGPRGQGEGFVGAEIPYVGDALSMLLLVPDEGRFEEIRSKLDPSFLDTVDATFTKGPYELLMPEWTTHSAVDFLPWLQDHDIAPGHYPKITPGAQILGAVHGADIAVDEWGTVAAAATALGFDESGPETPELTVKANRPFLYVVRHRASGMIMFAGQVTEL